MIILAIDPGSEQSAWLLYDTKSKLPIKFGINENVYLLSAIQSATSLNFLAVEMIASYGMPVGKTVFETCVWIGRFIQAWGGENYKKFYRKTDVCMHLCHNTAAKDSNIRQAIIDRYGGKNRAIGNKRCPKCKGKGWYGAGRPICPACKGGKWKYPPGPLFGVAEDVWAALAVAITAAESSKN